MRFSYYLCLIGFAIFVLISCSASSEEVKVKSNDIDSNYVFDDIPTENIYTLKTPEKPPDTLYIIQIGAFSSMERAIAFADFSRQRIKKEIKVEFNSEKNLYLVQIHPPFKTEIDALNFRYELKKYDEYQDAWILRKIIQK